MNKTNDGLRISDSIMEFAVDRGWTPSDSLLHEWPTFEQLSISEGERLGLAAVIEAALEQNDEEARAFKPLAARLRSGPVVFSELHETDGGLSDMLLVTSPH